jgi:cellulose biosynthesis protein BcsQ
LRAKFDYIIFDCAPGISAFTEVAIRLADLVIIPTIPDRLSTLGLMAFCNSVWRYRGKRSSALPKPAGLPYVLVTRKQHTKQHNLTLERLTAQSKAKDPMFRLFNTHIPQMAKIPDAMDLFPNGNVNFPTYTQKWGDMAAVMDKLNLELKGALHGARN